MHHYRAPASGWSEPDFGTPEEVIAGLDRINEHNRKLDQPASGGSEPPYMHNDFVFLGSVSTYHPKAPPTPDNAKVMPLKHLRHLPNGEDYTGVCPTCRTDLDSTVLRDQIDDLMGKVSRLQAASDSAVAETIEAAAQECVKLMASNLTKKFFDCEVQTEEGFAARMLSDAANAIRALSPASGGKETR